MTASLQDQATLDEPARQGASRVEWIRSRMPLMKSVREEFERSRPFEGHRIGVSLHIEPKTAVLLEILQAGGADIVGTGNFGSTQDDVAAWLRTLGMEVLGRRDDTFDSHQRNLEDVMDANPDVLLDNGADLAAEAVRRGATGTIIGATEETTSGGNRLRGEIEDRLTFPCIVINDSPLKAIAENRHAVGQSVVESFMRITNLMIPGRRFVVAGYGWCGRGIAQCFRAFGGKV
ncbi:MAG: adenosylhomocysteinase, partial [Boseongicola sp.]|nr:adenosylhomocysteinase [Boseongicola sp.]